MTGKERARLRAQANSLEPVFQIGKGDISYALIKQTADALKKRELIKIRALLESIHETPRQLADKLSEATGAEVVQVIGGSIVLYKENSELRAAEAEKAKRKKEAQKKAKLKARQNEAKKYPQRAGQTDKRGPAQKKTQAESRGVHAGKGRAPAARGVGAKGSAPRTRTTKSGNKLRNS